MFPIFMYEKAYVCVGEDVYFVHGSVGALMMFNLKTGHTKMIGQIPEEKLDGSFLYYSLAYENDNIIMLPASASHIYKYNIPRKSFSYIDFKEEIRNIRATYLYRGKLYCVRTDKSSFQILNLANHRIENCGLTFVNYSLENGYCSSVAVEDNKCASVNKTNKVIFWDFNENKFEVRAIGREDAQYSYIENDGESILLFDLKNGEVIRYFIDSDKETLLFADVPKEKDFRVINVGKDKLLLEEIGDKGMVYFIDKYGTPFETKRKKMVIKGYGNPYYAWTALNTKKGLLLLNNQTNVLSSFDVNGFEITLSMNDEDEKFLYRLLLKNDLIMEDSLFGLSEFLKI